MTNRIRFDAAWCGLALVLAAPSALAQGDGLARPLCAALEEAAVHAGSSHAGVRGQLLARIAEINRQDPAAFFRTQDELDGAAQAACPNERTQVLKALRLNSLAQITRHAG